MKYIDNIIPIYDTYASNLIKKESEIQKGVNDLLEEILTRYNRGKYYHPCEEKYSSNKGMPDIMGFYRYKDIKIDFAIELKKINYYPTTLQIKVLKEWKEQAKFHVSVCYSVKDTLQFLTDIGVDTKLGMLF